MAGIKNNMAPAPGPALPATNASVDDKNQLKLVSIEVCVLVTAAMLSLLVMFGSARRRYHSRILGWSVQGSYVFSGGLITFTLGQMLSARFRQGFFLVWALTLISLYVSVDCISAYSLEDNEQRRRYIFPTTVQVVLASGLAAIYLGTTLRLRIICFLCGSVIGLLVADWYVAFTFGSKYGIVRRGQVIAEFMKNDQHEESSTTSDNNTNPIVSMTAYKYPVTMKNMHGDHENLLVNEVWQCKGRLLSSTEDQDSKRKDICLSFALFNLLTCRFGGYHLPEYCFQEKTSRFVRQGLLADDDDNGGDRAFRVIEVELAFLYDLFYTKYAALFFSGSKYRLARLILVVVICYSADVAVRHYTPGAHLFGIGINKLNMELMVTRILVALVLVLEITQRLYLVFSYWGKLYLLCKYVKKPSLQQSRSYELILRFVCRCTIPLLKPWGRKLRQYSFLQSFKYRPSRILYSDFSCPYYYDKPPIGRKESSSIMLPIEVKRAVVARIKSDEPLPENGMTSLLRKHGVEREISWAWGLETQAKVIMVWHIATSICESALPKQPVAKEEHTTVATSLSNYCAYLVAFAPRLLPGRAYDTELCVDSIVEAATEFFKGCKDIDSMRAELVSSEQTRKPPQGSVLELSGELARKFLSGDIGDEARIWEILSDFWTEMILSLAPFGEATAHAEHLATGGEFLTHLWALLFHAGVPGRDSTVDANIV